MPASLSKKSTVGRSFPSRESARAVPNVRSTRPRSTPREER
jgi:hypothetical protein